MPAHTRLIGLRFLIAPVGFATRVVFLTMLFSGVKRARLVSSGVAEVNRSPAVGKQFAFRVAPVEDR